MERAQESHQAEDRDETVPQTRANDLPSTEDHVETAVKDVQKHDLQAQGPAE